jgi:AAA family ATP:ADP antiporter
MCLLCVYVQTGKSGGSLLQQALLITSAGSIVGIMPVLFAFFFAMLRGWNSAVYTLSNVRHYSYDSPISSLDEDAEGGDGGGLSSGAGLTQQQQQEQQAASLAAAAAAAGGSSAGLTAADQQELLAKLQGLADGSGDAGTAAAAAAKPPRGSKSFEAAMARSSSGDGGQDSSSSSSGGSNGSEADVRLHHDGIGLNGAGSQQGGQDHQGAGNSHGFVTLSHDAASSFRRSRREAAGHSSAQDANSSSNSDSSMAPEVDADSISSKSSSSSTSRVNQARDGGSS